MELDYDDLPEIFLQATFFFVTYLSFYRKYIYSTFDPLFIYTFTLAFSSVLIIRTLAETEPVYAIHFFVCHFFFFLGFALATHKFRISRQQLPSLYLANTFPDYKTFRIILYVLCGIYFLANIVLLYTTGFGLLSDNPTADRLENLEKGFAIIANINTAVGGFVLAGLFFLILSKFKYFDLILLLAVIFVNALDGKKGALLRVMVILAMLISHRLFNHNRKIVFRSKFITPLGVIAILIVSYIVLFKENAGDSDQAILKFVRRLLFGADSTLFFYEPVNEQYFAQFRFWEYPSHLFNQILGLLRLVPLETSHGDAMARNVFTHDTGVISGPNTPYYIEGQIYFGYYGAFIYSSIVGACYAFSREWFFITRFHSAFGFVLVCTVSAQASAIPIEVTYGVTNIFEVYFFVLPIYLLVNLAIHRRVKWRKLYFYK